MPQDEIVHAIGRVLGIEKLSELATRAVSAGEWWKAARYWSVLAAVQQELEGAITPGQAESRVKCLDAISALPSGSSYGRSQDDLEDFHLVQVTALAAGYDFFGELKKRPDEVRRVLATGAAIRDPLNAS